MGNFWRSTKAKTRGNRRHGFSGLRVIPASYFTCPSAFSLVHYFMLKYRCFHQSLPLTFSLTTQQDQSACNVTSPGPGLEMTHGTHSICPVLLLCCPFAKFQYNITFFLIEVPLFRGTLLCPFNSEVQGLYNCEQGLLLGRLHKELRLILTANQSQLLSKVWYVTIQLTMAILTTHLKSEVQGRTTVYRVCSELFQWLLLASKTSLLVISLVSVSIFTSS